MRGFHCNTRNNEKLGKATVKSGKGIISRFNNRWLPILICFAIIFSFNYITLQPQDVKAAVPNEDYLLDKTVTWSDGTTEHLEINNNGFLILDGTPRRLIGMQLMTHCMPYGEDGQAYLPENLALYEKQLDYLEEIGIRVIHLDLPYIRWWVSAEEEKEAYKTLMDMVYQHKMFVIPQVTGKWMISEGTLSNPDYDWGLYNNGMKIGSDSIGTWARRTVNIIDDYPNIIAMVAENELDYPLTAEGRKEYAPDFMDQEFTPRDVENYLKFLREIFEPLEVPIVHELVGYLNYEDIKAAAISTSSVPTFDCYGRSTSELNYKLGKITTWMNTIKLPTNGWWCMEFNHGWPGTNIQEFNADYIEVLFNHGAVFADLFPSNWAHEPNISFFDNNGNPSPKLQELVPDIARLQSPAMAQAFPMTLAKAPVQSRHAFN